MTVCDWLLTVLPGVTRNRAVAPSPSSPTTSDIPCEYNFEAICRAIHYAGDYDLHNMLRQKIRIEWCEWHLNMNKNNNAIKIAEHFHYNFDKPKLCSSVTDKMDVIEEMFSKLTTATNTGELVKKCFEEARKKNSPLPIVKAYTASQQLIQCLNRYLAANTYHALKLYCTLLNCPTLARTQENTKAFASMFFHPELQKHLIKQKVVYRGCVLPDKKLVENYKENSTIITTTFLSTSVNSDIANIFSYNPSENEISIFCTYKINNTKRRTALDLRDLSLYVHEGEILILPYVPFTIKSVERMDNDRRMIICFDECEESPDSAEQCSTSLLTGIIGESQVGQVVNNLYDKFRESNTIFK